MPRPLRIGLCVCLALCLQTLSPGAHAQTAPANPEAALRTQLLHHRFILRNFSGATKITGTWDGQLATLAPPPWHIFALLTVHGVTLKGNKITISATRNQIMPETSGKLVFNPNGTDVELAFTLQGDPAILASTLGNAIFFPHLNAAIAAIPKPFQQAVLQPPDAHKSPLPTCDCTNTTDACSTAKDPNWQHPKVLYQVEPDYTDEASQKKINASLQVEVQLNETGAITDEWLIRGAGYGLDESAVTAVSQYKFAPATCHNKPVATTIFVDVSFHTL